VSSADASSEAGTTPVLDLRGIHKSFPGARALEGVDLVVQPGEVHALVGENGAGKSTLIKIASGVLAADRGEVLLDGDSVTHPSRRAFQALGVRVIYQERQIAPDLSVAENVLLDRIPGRSFTVSWRRLISEARDRLEAVGLDLDPHMGVRNLSVAQWQLIELARAVDFGARLVIMDEPTASLSRNEVTRLFEVVERLRARGVAVLYISHHLDEIFQIAERVTVLRDGRLVFNGDVASMTTDQLVEKMFGQVVHHVDRQRSDRSPQVALELNDVVGGGRVHGVSCRIDVGEVVGFTGGVGSGTSELAALMVGATACDSGSVVLPGTGPVGSRHVAANSIAYLPADRKRRSLLLERSTGENLTLAELAVKGSLLNRPSRNRRRARELMERAEVKSDSPDRPVRTLSGGNQQKVVIGRWLDVGSKVLVFDEPTAGIDIPSKLEIYRTLRRLADEGAAVVVCSTDFQEIGIVSDRVLMLRDGRIVGEVEGEKATEQRLIEMEMSG
jgi:ABC-type sugar transport system ATPase subunit